MRLDDLDRIGIARLDQFARMQAKVVLLDAYLEEHGLLDEHGEPRPAAKLYPTIHNSAQRALDRLEAWLRDWQAGREQDPEQQLDNYLASLRATAEEDGADG